MSESAKPQNSLTLYSSGMADFVRYFEVGKETKTVEIFAREEWMNDVLDTLRIIGNVRLVNTPTFATSDQTDLVALDVQNVRIQMLEKFRGSDVSIHFRLGTPIIGRLLGRDVVETRQDGEVIEKYSVSILEKDTGRILTRSVEDIAHVEFLQPQVRKEVERALDASFQKIKKGNTPLRLEFQSVTGETTWVGVQYMVPMAAPKYTYRVESNSRSKTTSLEAMAIVDNTTDEDLEGFIVTVVNGSPISFTTDSANIRKPLRKRINLIDDSAEDPFDNGVLEVSYGAQGAQGPMAKAGGAAPMMAAYRGSVRAMSMSSAGYVGESDYESAGAAPNAEMQYAKSEEMVGDFQPWSSAGSLDIPANHSSLMPLFRKDLANDGKPVLVHNPQSNKFLRSVRVTNNTGFSLPKGSASVYIDGVNVGKGILKDSKEGETRLVSHQVETRVSMDVNRKTPDRETQVSTIADSVLISKETWLYKSHYVLKNQKNEDFRVYLTYQSQKSGSELIFDLPDSRFEKQGGCYQLVFNLAANETLKFEVVEKFNSVQRTVLTNHNALNFFRQIANTDLENNPKLKELEGINEKIQAKQQELNEIDEQLKELTVAFDRVVKILSVPNLADAAKNSANEEWSKTNDSLNESNNNKKKIAKEIKTLEKEFQNLLKTLAI